MVLTLERYPRLVKAYTTEHREDLNEANLESNASHCGAGL